MIGDRREQFFFVFAVERRLTGEHLEEQHAVRPPIDTFAVFLVQNDLRAKESSQQREEGSEMSHLRCDIICRQRREEREWRKAEGRAKVFYLVFRRMSTFAHRS